jgi:hypothetical protein
MVRRGYDMDGTLCEAPHIPGDKYRTLTEEEFQSRKEEIRKFHLSAKPLLLPAEGPFFVITGRRLECLSQTWTWLIKHYPNRVSGLTIHRGGPRDYPSMLHFKKTWIKDLQLEEFTDDDPKLVADLRELLPWVKIIHFDGSMSRDG